MTTYTHIKSISSVLYFVALCILLCHTAYGQQNIQGKIKGISFLGPHDPILEQSMVQSVEEVNANWIAIIPEATIDRGTLELIADEYNPNWSETRKGVLEIIKLAKESNKKIMLKPQVVLSQNHTPNELLNELASYVNLNYKEITDKTYGAEWRGDFVAGSEEDWQKWESSYEKYILKYASLASKFDIELFCIGTELREFAIRRPAFWKALIRKIRNVYNGPLTYSANWDEFDKIVFWQELDYIGTNTYNPISEEITPDVNDVFKSWRKIRTKIRKVSQKENRKVIITEYGYRNIPYAGLSPWVHDDGTVTTPNYEAQSNLYEAFYRSMWNESWVIGGFAWNWLYKEQADSNTDFSVQGKPAANVVSRYYGKDEN